MMMVSAKYGFLAFKLFLSHFCNFFWQCCWIQQTYRRYDNKERKWKNL